MFACFKISVFVSVFVFACVCLCLCTFEISTYQSPPHRSTFGVDSGVLTYLVGSGRWRWPRFIKISDQFGTQLGEKYRGEEEEEEETCLIHIWAG